ncbi:MAG: 5-formyltetrahydrofolate cyclo-ligase [Sediminicola sp.]|tara:strand:- start:51734 stop:52294 length:561 start_codon:yes stop_codon:yes gene_type:complete
MLKEELRSIYSEKRNQVPEDTLTDNSLQIANTLLTVPIWDFDYYHLFLPIASKKEIDTGFVLSILQGKDKNIVLPKISGKSTLSHFLLMDNTVLRANPWGIPEPVDGLEVPLSKIDVVFVPLLAFDLSGHRVGYGKGFYDTFLRQCRADVIKIGLSFFGPVERITDSNSSDVSLDFCITPDQVYSF